MNGHLFIDSWGWIILANEREEGHKKIVALYRDHLKKGRIVTTDYILDEVITFLYAKTPADLASKFLKELFASAKSNHIQIERIGPDRFEDAWKLRLKYQDHPRISFTDFTSFVVMKEIGIKQVLTNDRHFEQVNLDFQRVP